MALFVKLIARCKEACSSLLRRQMLSKKIREFNRQEYTGYRYAIGDDVEGARVVGRYFNLDCFRDDNSLTLTEVYGLLRPSGDFVAHIRPRFDVTI